MKVRVTVFGNGEHRSQSLMCKSINQICPQTESGLWSFYEQTTTMNNKVGENIAVVLFYLFFSTLFSLYGLYNVSTVTTVFSLYQIHTSRRRMKHRSQVSLADQGQQHWLREISVNWSPASGHVDHGCPCTWPCNLYTQVRGQPSHYSIWTTSKYENLQSLLTEWNYFARQNGPPHWNPH